MKVKKALGKVVDLERKVAEKEAECERLKRSLGLARGRGGLALDPTKNGGIALAVGGGDIDDELLAEEEEAHNRRAAEQRKVATALAEQLQRVGLAYERSKEIIADLLGYVTITNARGLYSQYVVDPSERRGRIVGGAWENEKAGLGLGGLADSSSSSSSWVRVRWEGETDVVQESLLDDRQNHLLRLVEDRRVTLTRVRTGDWVYEPDSDEAHEHDRDWSEYVDRSPPLKRGRIISVEARPGTATSVGEEFVRVQWYSSEGEPDGEPMRHGLYHALSHDPAGHEIFFLDSRWVPGFPRESSRGRSVK